jgi:hypothetical protein
MTTAATRQDIATALSTVPGLHGYPARPTVMTVGDGWPQWAGRTYAGGHAYANQWNVLIVLPQTDDVTADSYADEHGEQIIDALRPVMFVDGLQPAKIPVEGAELYALLVSGRSE